MVEWWNSLSPLAHVFAYAAIPATVVLFLQTILLLFGMGFGDADADFDAGDGADFDTNDVSDVTGLRLFSVRGIVAFFAVGGWLGIVMESTSVPPVVSVIVSLLGGIAALVCVALLFKWAFKLQESGNAVYSTAVGKNAEVYIRIPEKRTGKGKINVMVSEKLVEADAVTDCDYDIKPGCQVTVEAVEDENTFVVRPL